MMYTHIYTHTHTHTHTGDASLLKNESYYHKMITFAAQYLCSPLNESNAGNAVYTPFQVRLCV